MTQTKVGFKPYVNPIAHGDNTWYIKTDDVNNCKLEFFDFLKNHDNIEII